VDFENVRHCKGIKLFVAATNVRTGFPKIFRRQEMTADMVMASCCLPFIYQAVEIDGEAYWDGGYMGNPALYPLVNDCQSQDIVIVQINPIFREEIPARLRIFSTRINEITFNASLIEEVRAIAILKELIKIGHLEDQQFRDALFHRSTPMPSSNPWASPASSTRNGNFLSICMISAIGIPPSGLTNTMMTWENAPPWTMNPSTLPWKEDNLC